MPLLALGFSARLNGLLYSRGLTSTVFTSCRCGLRPTFCIQCLVLRMLIELGIKLLISKAFQAIFMAICAYASRPVGTRCDWNQMRRAKSLQY
jgi:hypothetical protein